jgi:ribosomal protection tetracycline resistance protein
VCEPIHRFQLEMPADALGPVLSALARLDAVPGAPAVRDALCALEGDVAAARAHELQQRLSGLTRGEGVLECRSTCSTSCAACERHGICP